MMKKLNFVEIIEIMGGKKEISVESPLWGIWWGILTLVILIFSGQSSKFIYIDF